MVLTSGAELGLDESSILPQNDQREEKESRDTGQRLEKRILRVSFQKRTPSTVTKDINTYSSVSLRAGAAGARAGHHSDGLTTFLPPNMPPSLPSQGLGDYLDNAELSQAPLEYKGFQSDLQEDELFWEKSLE